VGKSGFKKGGKNETTELTGGGLVGVKEKQSYREKDGCTPMNLKSVYCKRRVGVTGKIEWFFNLWGGQSMVQKSGGNRVKGKRSTLQTLN